MIQYTANEHLSAEEYLEFLTRTDLGHEYPLEDLLERMPLHLQHCNLFLTARNPDGLLVGACIGMADFAYYVFITDLGVARDYTHQGIGTRLLSMVRETVGERYPILVYLDSADAAIGYYTGLGMVNYPTLMASYQQPWTLFELTPEKLAQLREQAGGV
ncbi:MAG: GNAT family N-acetyltransferase [Anaerolineae bacterium]|nr:GNAT family N-acetyltransferase [Anaerolineae bacterium]